MATRNRTFVFRRYRDALKSVRNPSNIVVSSTSGGGPVIEMSNATSLLKQKRSYVPLSTDDPGTSKYVHHPTYTIMLPLSPKMPNLELVFSALNFETLSSHLCLCVCT